MHNELLETTLETPTTTSAAARRLKERIENREATVAVIGLGYVGLPLVVAYAEAGFRVIGIDLDKKKVASLNAGRSYIPDIETERLAKLVRPRVNSLSQNGHASNGHANNGHSANGHSKNGKHHGIISATTDFDVLLDVDAVIICVPTPLDKTKEPDMSYIVSAVNEIAQRLHTGMLVVLESTTYPGTTEEVVLPRLARNGSGGNDHFDLHSPSDAPPVYVVGRDFFLAFSPERIDPGRRDFDVRTTPKVIGGVTPACLEAATALYSCAIDRVVPVSLPKTAEMVKLLENTFRAVNIGLINEMAIMCSRLGIDVWEVIDAAKTKPFGYMPFYPGPGLGGHCIPVDPQYLAWKLKTLNYNARFIQLAEEVNFSMPEYVVGKVIDALNEDGKAMKGSRILVLGAAYKADVGDLRESPSLDLMHLMRTKKAQVSYHDPFVPQLAMDNTTLRSVTLDERTLRQADCVVISTAHSSYDWEWIVKNSKLVVDTRNATRNVKATHRHIVTL